VITFSEQALMGWLSPVIWPFLRVLALFGVAPVFSSRSIPVRARIGLALLVAVAAQAGLPTQPVVSLSSPQALGVAVQQILVGLSIGFAARLVFAAMELAGEMVGLQMGLNFAGFFDPASSTQTSAVSRFFAHVSMLVFVVVNGHLMLLLAVIRSFEAFPLDRGVLDILRATRLHELGAQVFANAFWVALPMIGMLLLVNLALGIMSRVAPQMSLYSVGFPVTLAAGLVGMAATLPFMEQTLVAMMERSIELFMR
jgi:flagellar biosynthesis protein FliR